MKVLCVWELGGNLGHITNLVTISRALFERGYEVTVALKELHTAERIFANTPVRFLQSPVWLGPRPVNKRQMCIADILLGLGYADEQNLCGLALAWRGLFDLVKPDVVVFDYAPTALLAARGLPFKKIVTGIGFGELVEGRPVISLRPGEHIPIESILRSEARVVKNINYVAKKLGQTPVEYIGDIYAVDKTIIASIPEVDLYAKYRNNALYADVGRVASQFPNPVWPESPHPKVFAYLNANAKNVEAVVEVLTEMPVNELIFLRNAEPKQIKRFKAVGTNLVQSQVDIQSALSQVSLTLAHGGNTLIQSLLMGTPVIAMPTQLEQGYTSYLITKQQLGAAISPDDSKTHIQTTLAATLSDITIIENCKKLAEHYAAQQLIPCEQLIADCCDNLLGINDTSQENAHSISYLEKDEFTIKINFQTPN